MNVAPGTASFAMLLALSVVLLIAAALLYFGGFWPFALFLLSTAGMSEHEGSANDKAND